MRLIRFFGVLAAVCLSASTSLGEPEIIRILDPFADYETYFGTQVAAVGTDKLLITASGIEDTPPTWRGRVQLFDLSGSLLLTFTNPVTGGALSDQAIAIGPDKILIGSPYDPPDNAGAAHLFDLQGNWLATFTNPAPEPNDFLGTFVNPCGSDKVLVTAATAATFGKAFLYDLQGNLLNVFTNPLPQQLDWYGAGAAAFGTNHVIIGSPHKNTAYVYDFQGALIMTITNPTPSSAWVDNRWFGFPIIPINNDKVLIGDYKADGDTFIYERSGAMYLYDLQGNLLETFRSPTPSWGIQFGFSCAQLDANRIIICAPQSNDFDASTGTAYIFSLDGQLLETIYNPPPYRHQYDHFASSVAVLDPEHIVLGARYDSNLFFRSGAAYLYDYNPKPPVLCISATDTNTLMVSWRDSLPGYSLQQNTNLATTNWSAVVTPPETDGTLNWIIASPNSGNGFYRLAR